MVQIFARATSSKIDLAGIYFQTKLTFSEILKHKAGNKLTYFLHFLLCHIFLEYCNPRFLDKTEISIQKYNHQDIIHTLPTFNTEDIIELLEPNNHSFLATEIREKPYFYLFPFLRHLPLLFKSIYCAKANVLHSYCYN